ncbi:MAG: class I SAM-dependent methyltransferase [Phascolarctobacterium sp.]|nr:class I SAM-dependent methyltransferase [Phascolarctobacterium sp.]
MTQTLSYYNQNAASFSEETISVDFTTTQNKFLSYLPPGAKILDFGCGSGRDAKYFLDHGYAVTATDGSKELCALASKYTGLAVKHMLFTELEEIAVYDGVWACASILHCSQLELKDVFPRIMRALRSGGILYASFKYGTGEKLRGGRFYTDFTQGTLHEFLEDVHGLVLLEQWVTEDVRESHKGEDWLNVILQKK